MDYDENCDYLFKIILIGNPGVGKTCLVQRFKNGIFIERCGSTIGVDFATKTIKLDGKIVKLQVWDTGGQERFRTITQSYYRNANGIVIAYDITKRDSFKDIPHWIEDVRKYASTKSLKLLIGNKRDLNSGREVTEDEAKQLAAHYDIIDAIETSAKDATNVEEAFMRMTQELIGFYETSSFLEDDETFAQNISLDSRKVHSSWGCCS